MPDGPTCFTPLMRGGSVVFSGAKFNARSSADGGTAENGLREAVEFAKVMLRDVKKSNDTRKLGTLSNLGVCSERRPRHTSFTLSSKHVKHVTVSPTVESGEPARLVHDLNRILYQPLTLHPLRDSRSGVYNFQPALETIPKSKLVDNAPNRFITPYRDESLLRLAEKFNQKYVSSTSSMTSTLSHLHFLLSNFRPLNIIDTSISKNFPQTKCNFTKGAKFPATIILRKLKNSVISLDSDKSLDREIILSTLGNSLEEFLTDTSHESDTECYHFSKIDKFILRSQLDAFDPKLPGNGVFDLKTRAVAAIRHDLSYVEKNNNFTGYEIDKIHGEFESLEREFFDLVKSTLLKYSLQAKIGKMDGIFVAYHNITKMFGFQYLPLDEIEYIIHSNSNPSFQRSLKKRDKMLKKICGEDEFIMKCQRQDRDIAKAVADSEFKMSIVLLRNILVHVENSLRVKGVGDWQKLKLMMKTEMTKDTSFGSHRDHKVPVLRIVALPLPFDYEDEKLDVKGKTNTQILDEIKLVRKENQRLLEKQKCYMIGFEIKVEHFYKHHPDSISLPYFAKPENNILDSESCRYITQRINENFYEKRDSFQHPSFFHPTDVSTWRTNCTFTDIEREDRLAKLYGRYLEEKLKSLEDQCIVKESLANPKSLIADRIKKLMSKNEIEDVPDGADLRTDLKERKPTVFQNQLRAYAMKERTKEPNDKSSLKLTWYD